MKRALLTLVAVAVVSGAFLAPAGAAESHSVSLAPRTGTWFTVELAPGEQYRGETILTNLLNERVDGFLYSADGFSTPQGGFALQERSTRGKAVAAWATVPVQRVTLKPHESRIVSFTMTVPRDTEPGDYLGGIVFERDRQESGAAPGTKATFGVIERVGARIYLTVAGELLPSLTIVGLVRRGSRFELTVRNDGNVHLDPDASIEVSSMLGRRAQIKLDKKSEPLYPQQKVTLTGTWVRPGFLGRFRADATVAYKGGKAARGMSFWLIPWKLLILALIALCLVVLGTVRMVRWIRRARRALQVQRQLGAAVPAPQQIVESPSPSIAAAPELAPSPQPAARPRSARAHAAVHRKGATTAARTTRRAHGAGKAVPKVQARKPRRTTGR